MNRALTTLAILCVIGWFARAAYIYGPFLVGYMSFGDLPRMMGELYDYFAKESARPSLEFTKEDFLEQTNLSFAFWAGFHIMAIAISFAGVALRRLRALFVLASASLYLGIWLPDFQWPVSIPQVFELKMLTAEKLNRWGGFVLLNVALPTLFIGAWLVSLSSLLLRVKVLKRTAT